MEIDVGEEDHSVLENVETVEVVASGDDIPVTVTSSGSVVGSLMDQHIIIANPEGILVPTSEVQIESQSLSSQVLEPESSGFSMSGMGVVTIPVEPPTSPTHIMLGSKRSHPDTVPLVTTVAELPMTTSSVNSHVSLPGELPRKKSRNYLDSHKTIEKKRRDRINQCLETLKTLVPDCRQYGSKKLDKAEILEMCIEYIQKTQTQGGVSGRLGNSGLDLNLNQREWANDLCTWVISNKILYSGSNALDQFCQALLLHLQGMGSGNALATATSMLIHQANSCTEEDALLRQQTVAAQVAILQQLQQQLGAFGGGAPRDGGGSADNSQVQQAQLSQLQALLLLQQHQQQQQQQQQQQESEAQSLQLQQLQQLQALLLQHLTNEAMTSSTTTSATPTSGSSSALQNLSDSVVNGALGSGVLPEELTRHDVAAVSSNVSPSAEQQQQDQLSVVVSMASKSGGTHLDHSTEVELAHPSDPLGDAVTTEETVYTTGISGGLDDENLTVAPTPNSAITTSSSQMWSTADSGQSSALLMLGGGSESEGEGPGPGGAKSQLIETSIIGPQDDDVELLAQPEQ